MSQFHFRKKKKKERNIGFLFVSEAGFELELSRFPLIVESKVFSSVVVILCVKVKKQRRKYSIQIHKYKKKQQQQQ